MIRLPITAVLASVFLLPIGFAHEPSDPRNETTTLPAPSSTNVSRLEARPTTKARPANLPPNILLLYADDLGIGDIGIYGSPDIETPNIDRLAREGLLFTDFHSNAAVCAPSRAALMTGRYQQRTGVQRGIKYFEDDQFGLNVGEVTIADRLGNRSGYATGIIGKWHLGRGTSMQWMPSNRGFDLAYAQVSGGMDYWSHNNRLLAPTLYRGLTVANDMGFSTHLFAAEAIRFMRMHANEAFFLYVPFNAPHTPLNQPDRPQEADTLWGAGSSMPPEEQRDRYRVLVENMDQVIGAILLELDRLGLSQETLVIFTSDNGSPGGWGNNGVYRGSKSAFYEGGHRVPFIARHPGRIQADTTCDILAMGMDLHPTFLKVAGDTLQPEWELDGLDLSPYLFAGSNQVPERNVFWGIDDEDRLQRAVRAREWKLVIRRKPEDPPQMAIIELFNLNRDPGESSDLAAQKPHIVQLLLSELATWETDVGIESIVSS